MEWMVYRKHMTTKIKLKKHNVTLNTTFRYGDEMWILNKKDNQHLEAAQIYLYNMYCIIMTYSTSYCHLTNLWIHGMQ
jgi:hypothetical protein